MFSIRMGWKVSNFRYLNFLSRIRKFRPRRAFKHDVRPRWGLRIDVDLLLPPSIQTRQSVSVDQPRLVQRDGSAT